ncbi:MAG: T9SS type A sorting domain-containing protein, partial [Calditrichota bacterium]
KNAVGGEGAWNPTFQPSESQVLLAGKDPVAADSIASYLMGNDPEAQYLQLPDGGQCDNYLEHLHQKGMGTNQLDEIELVGDGADIITKIRPEYRHIVPSEFILFQNFPNPFNASTIIKFYLPQMEYVTIKLYNIAGQELETLLADKVSAGQHELRFMANGLASGVYLYRMQAGHFSDSKMLIYQK